MNRAMRGFEEVEVDEELDAADRAVLSNTLKSVLNHIRLHLGSCDSCIKSVLLSNGSNLIFFLLNEYDDDDDDDDFFRFGGVMIYLFIYFFLSSFLF